MEATLPTREASSMTSVVEKVTFSLMKKRLWTNTDFLLELDSPFVLIMLPI
jgi:hypothetical protein